MLREENIAIEIKSQGYECKTYIANVEGTEAVLLFESQQRTADMRCPVCGSTVGRQFKAAMGVYFNDYLTSLRIRHAERLLKTTDMRIADIAAAVGFSSLNYFGNVYK